MHHFSFRDNSVDLTNYSEYDLSILASPDGFCFIIRDIRSGIIRLFSRYMFSLLSDHLMIRKINELLSENEFLKQPYGKTTLVFGVPSFSLIPESLSYGKLADYLLSTGQKYHEDCETVTIPISNMDASLAFSAGKELLDFLTTRFPGAVVSHELSFLLRNIFSANDQLICFHLHRTWFYAIGYTEGRVEFLNTFDYMHVNDLIYFMLSVLEQPELQGLPVKLSGWIAHDDPLVEVIRKQIPGAEMAVAYKGFRPVPAEIPFHYLPGIIAY